MPISGIVVGTGTEASGRRQFSEIIGELARPVDEDDSTIRALAADAFRSAVRTMNRKGLWPWEYQEETVTATPNIRYSTVNSAVKKPLSMHYVADATGLEHERLAYIPVANFREQFIIDVNGRPNSYTIPNLFETGQVQWYPTPGAAYSFKFTYYRVTPAPRNESETVEVPDFPLECYMAYAWVEFLKRLSPAQRPMDLAIAMAESRTAFREMSAHVVSPGDRMRETIV